MPHGATHITGFPRDVSCHVSLPYLPNSLPVGIFTLRRPWFFVTTKMQMFRAYLVGGRLESTSLLEELLDLLAVLAVLDNSLKIGVTANVLLADEDVGDGALTGQLEKGVLDIGAVALLVELVGGVLGVETVKDLLGVGAVGAVGLAEDNCLRCFSLATVCFMKEPRQFQSSAQR